MTVIRHSLLVYGGACEDSASGAPQSSTCAYSDLHEFVLPSTPGAVGQWTRLSDNHECSKAAGNMGASQLFSGAVLATKSDDEVLVLSPHLIGGVNSFHTKERKWSTSRCRAPTLAQIQSSAPQIRHMHAMVSSVDAKFLIFGGSKPSQELLGDLQQFNFGMNQWVQVSGSSGDPPCARDKMGSASSADDLHMYIFGGRGKDGSFLNDIHVYNVSGNYWNRLFDQQDAFNSDTPSPRHSAGCALKNNSLYVFGGYGSGGALNDLFRFDLSSSDGMTWSRVSVTGLGPSARTNHVFVGLASSFLVFGGEGGDGEVLGDTHVLFPTSGRYTRWHTHASTQ